MPEKGLYTGLIIIGAIGSGKTASCMNPFMRQLLEWQHQDKVKRAAALVLEVKGDFCYDVQAVLREYDRFETTWSELARRFSDPCRALATRTPSYSWRRW